MRKYDPIKRRAKYLRRMSDPVLRERDRINNIVAQKKYREKLKFIPNNKPMLIRKERIRKSHVKYLSERNNSLRAGFFKEHGGICKLCSTTKNLVIRNLINTKFVFQKIAYWKESSRNEVLKTCILICQKCSRNNPNLTLL